MSFKMEKKIKMLANVFDLDTILKCTAQASGGHPKLMTINPIV